MLRTIYFKNTLFKTLCCLTLLGLTMALQANEKRKEIDMLYSQMVSELPENSQIIASPYPENLGTYGDGVKSEVENVDYMFGGQVLRVTTPKKTTRMMQGTGKIPYIII